LTITERRCHVAEQVVGDHLDVVLQEITPEQMREMGESLDHAIQDLQWLRKGASPILAAHLDATFDRIAGVAVTLMEWSL
jgi:hypothetical protein